AVLGASIFESCLSVQERSKVRVSFLTISECVGLSVSSVSTNWGSLFDNQVRLDASRLERVGRSESVPSSAVSAVVKTIQRALQELDQELDEWFESVERQAIDLVGQLSERELTSYYPDLLAATAVYGVIRQQVRPRVKLSQREAGYVCDVSSSMISKVWIDLFKQRSGTNVQT
ncbi:MAG: hypothetical protein ACTSSD_19685, partial [Candidatus Thorarchaeota archaeon]